MSTAAVVMCTYNGEKHLAEQLNSIYNQSRKIDELVVVDDGSTDRTIDLVKELSASHSNIKTTVVVNSENLGYVRNFQKAAGLATADIIFFSDQDDVWDTTKIEKMLPLFENPTTWAAYHDGDLMDENGNLLQKTLFGTRRRAILSEGLNRDVHDVVSNIDINGCTMAVRKTLIDQCPLPEKRTPELWGHDHWWALHAHALQGLAVVNEKLFSYRIHSGNASGKINKGFEFDKIKQNWKLAKAQGHDFYFLRYKALKESFEQMPEKWFGSDEFRKSFFGSVDFFIQQNKRRKEMAGQSILSRIKTARQIYKSGFYQNYLNGIATAVRDVLL